MLAIPFRLTSNRPEITILQIVNLTQEKFFVWPLNAGIAIVNNGIMIKNSPAAKKRYATNVNGQRKNLLMYSSKMSIE